MNLEDTQRLLKVASLLEQVDLNEAYLELLEFIAERGYDETKPEKVTKYENRVTAWADTDGSYGTSLLITFNPEDLTFEQWDIVGNLPDSERLPFIQAVLDGADLSEWDEY
jgi:hypothetical protein